MNKIIKTRHGEVRGSAVDGVNTFKGIHYAVLRAAAALCAILALLFGLASMLPVVSPKGAHIAINMAATAPKLLGGALAPFIMLFGGLGAALGLLLSWMNRSRWRLILQSKAGWRSKFRLALGGPALVFAGVTGAILAGVYFHGAATAPADFAEAFGADWQAQIPHELTSQMLSDRWTWIIPEGKAPQVERAVPIWTPPGKNQAVTSDLWLPPTGIKPSGLAVIYVNLGGWTVSTPDAFVGTLFSHLTSQGHVVLNLTPRKPIPDVNLYDMEADVKHAIAWMKQSGVNYGVSPDRIVLSGSSSGAQLAFLAAYAPDHPEFTTDDLKGTDLSVRAVAVYYPVIDLRTFYQGGASKKMMQNVIGGLPDQMPAMYDLFSPINHVSADSPPTLIFHGDADRSTPVISSRALHQKLKSVGVPSVYVEFPQTDHGFDIILPRLNPATQKSLYELDRFLALMASSQNFSPSMP